MSDQACLLSRDFATIHDAVLQLPILESFELQILPPSARQGEAHQYSLSIQRHLKVAFSAIALTRRKSVPIQQVGIDIFSSFETVDSLGLRQEIADGLTGISGLNLRGQYRFWEGTLSLGVLASLKHLALSDCTILYDTLRSFLLSQQHQLEWVTLDAVGLLPYSHLGYLRWSGGFLEVIPWFLSIQPCSNIDKSRRRNS